MCIRDSPTTEVLCLRQLPQDSVRSLLQRYELQLVAVPEGLDIPGSHWGPPEAGLIGQRVYARLDTPIHSILHEAAHLICMDEGRRRALHTDAGGDDLEEAAVCYLQILLAETLPGISRARAFADMDAWGYSFRLGSAAAWFEQDAQDARDWLRQQGLIDAQARLIFRLR